MKETISCLETNCLETNSLESSFKLANIFAMSGWLVLIVLPNWQYSENFILYLSFILLAALYVFLLQKAMRTKPRANSNSRSDKSHTEDKPNFTNLRGVLALLKNPTGALAAWVHILAFDLMMGLYIHNEGAAANISHWYLLPCYLLTLIFGPIGVMLFLALKFLLAT
jgi:hypothetical protein